MLQVGESAGSKLTLAAGSLCTSEVGIYGPAKGLNPETMGEAHVQIAKWAQSGELTFDVAKVPLSDVETAWQRTDLQTARRGPVTGEPGQKILIHRP